MSDDEDQKDGNNNDVDDLPDEGEYDEVQQVEIVNNSVRVCLCCDLRPRVLCWACKALTAGCRAQDGVSEAAMAEVVQMYGADNDDDDDDGADSESRSSSTRDTDSSSDGESEESDSDAEPGARRPPSDVSDTGYVPAMSEEDAISAAESAMAEDIVQSPSVRLRVGYADTQGVRRTMEDRMTVFGRFKGVSSVDYFGVFDGHGGDETAHYCGENLHNVIFEHIKAEVAAGSDDPKVNFALVLEEPEKLRTAIDKACAEFQATLEAKKVCSFLQC